MSGEGWFVILILGLVALMVLAGIFVDESSDPVRECRQLGKSVPTYQRTEVIKACLESIGRSEKE